MDNIRFSVHIPVYNVEKYLAECVDSVLNQTFSNFEIILVDDGSTDGSSEICDSFTDPRVRVFHNENHGVLYTRYFSVMQARGEYSVFIDSDDYVDLDFLENVDRIIEKEKCDIVAFSYKRVFENRFDYPVYPWKEDITFEGNRLAEFEKEQIFNPQMNSLCSKVILTSLLQNDKTGFEKLKARTGEDLLASLYPVFNSNKIVFVNEHWYNYRQHNESVTHNADPDRYKSIISVRKEVLKYFQSSSFYSKRNLSRFSSNFIKSMMDCVTITAGSNLDFKRKLQTFKDIISDGFYTEMLEQADKKMLPIKSRLILELFNKKQYRLIVLICRIFGK